MNSSKSVTAVFVPASIPGVTRVDFTSDHDLLTDETETFAGEGNVYTAPTWDPSIGHNNPISQTKDTRLTAEVTLTLPPCVGGFKLEGKFSGTITLTGTVESPTQTVTVESTTNLPNGFEHYNQAITWTLLTTDHGTVFNMGTSGPHEVFVTWERPYGETPTYKRFQYLFQYINGQRGNMYPLTHLIAKAANEGTRFERYSTPDLWLCMDNKETYPVDCGEGARLAYAYFLRPLGWPVENRGLVTAYPSTDSIEDFPGCYSDCSQQESGLYFRYEAPADDEAWYPAECGFRIRANAEGQWFYVTVHDLSEVYSYFVSEPEASMYCLYKLMDAQYHGAPCYRQYLGTWPNYQQTNNLPPEGEHSNEECP